VSLRASLPVQVDIFQSEVFTSSSATSAVISPWAKSAESEWSFARQWIAIAAETVKEELQAVAHLVH
jgi:hypothetical protein